MIGAALLGGERPRLLEWIGLLAALGGLIYLVFPGLSAPPLINSALMIVAGISWGFYTLRGKKSVAPLADTTGNFLRAVPFVLLTLLFFLPHTRWTEKGFWLAVLSGAVASGIGYAFWYAALKYHTATRAAILQLSVPILAAAGGIVLLGETINARLLTATTLIIGGIAAAIAGRGKPNSVKNSPSEIRQ